MTDFGQNQLALWVYSTAGEQAYPFATVQKPHAVGGLSFHGGNAPGVAKGGLLLCLWLESSSESCEYHTRTWPGSTVETSGFLSNWWALVGTMRMM